MKATGIVRKMDALGRVVLPIELRKKMGIHTKDPIEIFTGGDCIYLKKYMPGCIFCGEITDGYYLEQHVCEKCLAMLRNQ